jgi:hypothetical protein
MPTATAVTMEDLELEQAELLPSRETLCVPCCYRYCCYHYSCYHDCYRSCCSDHSDYCR